MRQGNQGWKVRKDAFVAVITDGRINSVIEIEYIFGDDMDEDCKTHIYWNYGACLPMLGRTNYHRLQSLCIVYLFLYSLKMTGVACMSGQ